MVPRALTNWSLNAWAVCCRALRLLTVRCGVGLLLGRTRPSRITLRTMPDDQHPAETQPFEIEPSRPRRSSSTATAVPWLVGGVFVMLVAVAAGLATAYVVATFRAAPPPQSALVTPRPIPTPTPTPSPSPEPTPSPTVEPTVSPTVEPSPTPGPSPLVHIVSRGESLSTIATRYGTTIEAIIELNQLANPNLIVPNQRLLIPPPAAPDG